MEQNQDNLTDKSSDIKLDSKVSETPKVNEDLTPNIPPTLKKQDKRKLLLLIGGVFLLLFIGLGVVWWQRAQIYKKGQQPTSTQTPPLQEATLQLKDEYIPKGEEEIAYLQNGKILLISKDLEKKMEYGLTENMEAITDFTFSSDGQILYWLTGNGELWKENERSEINPLITKKQDMTDAVQDTFGVGEPFSYVKGKVTNFYLSPDSNYIAYETLEKYTGCCGSTSDIPSTQLRIMKSDGTNKVTVAKPSTVNRELAFFDGWFPDSKRILFHFAAPDEATQGSPFFEVGLDGKNPKKFTAIDYQEFGNTITVAGTAPIFSPDGERIAYVEGGVVGEGRIWIANADGTQKKLLLDDESLNVANLGWSENGNLLLVNRFNKVIAVNIEGKVVFQEEVSQSEEFANTISPDYKYITSLNRTSNDKANKLFILNLDTRDKREFSISDTNNQPSDLYVYPQFFSANGRLYYLAGSNPLRYPGKDTRNPTFQLWVVDTSTWKNYKVADNVSLIKPHHSVTTSAEVAITDGNVYRILSSGEKEILLDKEDFRKNTERYLGQPDNYTREDPFFTFSYVDLSPDKTKMLLLAQGGISIERLYYASSGGKGVVQIGVASEAAWSNNSRYIAYANKPADAGPIIRVYVYDTQINEQTDISNNYAIENSKHDYLGFSNLRWLSDDSGVEVKYDAYTGKLPYGDKVSEGETTLTFKE